jgi:predicted ATPase/DNA-binding SARP family transcriptional activator
MIEFRVLGSLEVVGQDGPLALGAPKQRALLAALVVHRGEVVSSERLVDELWGEQAPASAIKLVQGYVSNLRKVLGGGLLVTQGRGYVLRLAPGRLDVDRFEALVAAGRRASVEGNARAAAARLREALQVWRGPALAEFSYESFAQATIARLEEERLAAREQRIEADLQLGEHHRVVSELEALMIEQPMRERLVGQLMLALYRCERQADALEVYQRARGQLTAELGLEPGPALRALQVQILEQDEALAASYPSVRLERSTPGEDARAVDSERAFVSSRRPGRPPAVATATVGREREIGQVVELLARSDVQLVTLTGPGGVGKTRVALEVAHAVGSGFGDGVCWVELAGVARVEDVWSTVASALDLRPAQGESVDDALERHLAGQHLLLVLDNFEHVLDAAGRLGRLLAASEGDMVLVTSRERLSMSGEHRVEIAPLEIPPQPERATLDDLEATPASAVFLAAARRHDSRFAPTVETAPLIAGLCAQVDGLPLGLELAAGATRLLTIQELAVDLGGALRTFASGPRDGAARHHTLDATIGWSYGLLDATQKRAFVAFAVFAGGASLDAAQAVTGATPAMLHALVEKSLLARREQLDGTTRLVMLETIHQYALRRLNDDPDSHGICRRHCEYYLRLVEHNIPRLSTNDEQQAVVALDAEIDNVRGALRWAIRAAPDTGLRLAGQFARYWGIRSDPEGLQWLDNALRAAGERAPPVDRARALIQLAAQFDLRYDGDAAIGRLREALALYRQAHDHAGISESLRRLAVVVGVFHDDLDGEREYASEACRHAKLAGNDALLGMALGRLAAVSGEQRRGLLEQAADLLTPTGNFRELASLYSTAAYVALSEDRTDEATNLLDTALQAVSRIDDPWETMMILGNIGLTRLFASEPERAREAFGRQLRLAVEHRFRKGADEAVVGLAAVAAAEGRDEISARLRGAAHALGYPAASFDKRIDDQLERHYFRPARTRYGHAAWQTAERVGAALRYPQATAYALQQTGQPSTQEQTAGHPTARGPGSLASTPRGPAPAVSN